MNFLPPYSTKREEKAICERKVEGDDGSSANERRIGGRMSREEGREVGEQYRKSSLSLSFLLLFCRYIPYPPRGGGGESESQKSNTPMGRGREGRSDEGRGPNPQKEKIREIGLVGLNHHPSLLLFLREFFNCLYRDEWARRLPYTKRMGENLVKGFIRDAANPLH